MLSIVTKPFHLNIFRIRVIEASASKLLLLTLLSLLSMDIVAQVTINGSPGEWPNALNTSPAATFKRDVSNVSNSSDDQFTNGSADPDPISGKGGWVWNLGNTNNKTDITNAGAVLYTDASQNIILAFFADRTINNGSAEIHTWFFRSSVSLLTDGSGKFSGVHTADLNPGDNQYTGDILIVSEFTQGGSKPLLKVYNWIGGKNPLQLAFTIDPTVSTQFADAAVNATPVAVPTPTYVEPVSGEKWEYTTSGGVAGTYPIGDFFEAALNLTKMNVPACFTTFMTATRNSPSQNASLQDFAIDKFEASPPPPDVEVVNNCDGTSVLTAKNFTGTLTWSTGATTTSITVTDAGEYTVTQTINGCTGNPGKGTANPKSNPTLSLSIIQPTLCGTATGTLQVCSPVAGYKYSIVGNPASEVEAEAGKEVKFSGLAAGSNPSIKVVSTNGCDATANCSEASTSACGTTVVPLANRVTTIDAMIEGREKTSVIAAPNPFNERIRFSLKSGTSGQGSLELYNMLGQKVKTVFRGQVNAGQVQTIDYAVPVTQRSNLIYVFRVGNEQTSGKLIGLKQ